jgi:transposase
MAKLGLEARMTIKELARRGMDHCAIARALGVTEGAVRYHLRRMAAGAVDGRGLREHRADPWGDRIADWLGALGETAAVNLAALHAWLVAECDYPGTLRSVQRYVAARFPKPRQRARRRVETPPGAQAQADWAAFPGVLVRGRRQDLLAFRMQLSHSRMPASVWSERKDQLAWHHVHNEGFRRLLGVPAVVRVDNERTAVARGAGAWGELNDAYRRYAQTVRFHIDPCPPRTPEAKGKVERGIRDQRFWADPRGRSWDSLEQIQEWTDECTVAQARRRLCPATGTSVHAAWESERPHLAPLPVLPEPFDLVVTRTVGTDCTVHFEGRAYSVPFRFMGQRVEVRGCSGRVQMLHGAAIVAEHRRGTAERLVLDPRHFEGEATDTVLPPVPLGRMGRRLAEIAALEPQRRPLDLYAALAEVAR